MTPNKVKNNYRNVYSAIKWHVTFCKIQKIFSIIIKEPAPEFDCPPMNSLVMASRIHFSFFFYAYSYSFILKDITREQPSTRKRCIGQVEFLR